MAAVVTVMFAAWCACGYSDCSCGCNRYGCGCDCSCRRRPLVDATLKQYSWGLVTQHCEAEDSSTVRFLFFLYPICYHRFPFTKPKLDESAGEEWAQCSLLGPRAGRMARTGARGAGRAHREQICIVVLTPSSWYPLLLQQSQRKRGYHTNYTPLRHY